MKKIITAILGMALIMCLFMPGVKSQAEVSAEEAERMELILGMDMGLFFDCEGTTFNSFYYDNFPDSAFGDEQRSVYRAVREELLYRMCLMDDEWNMGNGILPEDRRVICYVYSEAEAEAKLSKTDIEDALELMLLDCVYLPFSKGDYTVAGTGNTDEYKITFTLDESLCTEDAIGKIVLFSEPVMSDTLLNMGDEETLFNKYSISGDSVWGSEEFGVVADSVEEDYFRENLYPEKNYVNDPEVAWDIVSYLYRAIMINNEVIPDNKADGLAKTIRSGSSGVYMKRQKKRMLSYFQATSAVPILKTLSLAGHTRVSPVTGM